MRKADYSFLAAILKDEIQTANTVLYSSTSSVVAAAQASARKEACKRIAHTFAARAAVDSKLFLTACGLEV